VILNKDADRDLQLTIDLGPAHTVAELETLRAPAIDARVAQIAREASHGGLKRGRLEVAVPHASGMRITAR
jgi:hypothetical protein